MKLIIVLALFAVASAFPTSTTSRPDVASLKWAEFKNKFNKTYSSIAEEVDRFKIYLKNVKFIAEHNRRYDNGEVKFFLGINKFADLTFEEFKSIYLGFKGEAHKNGVSLKANDLPAAIDWRQKGVVTEVKDQGQCGSCWAFSAIASTESRVAQKTGKLVELSEQNIMDCDQKFGDKSCNGGLMDHAFEYIISNKGVDTEKSYPYEAKDDTCRFRNSTVGAKITSFVDIEASDEQSLKTGASTGLVSVAIEASIWFQFYFGGIYTTPCGVPAQLNHGVTVVGYGTEKSTDYWIVKNSWGASWGEKGYIRMQAGKNLCGIADSASYPVA